MRNNFQIDFEKKKVLYYNSKRDHYHVTFKRIDFDEHYKIKLICTLSFQLITTAIGTHIIIYKLLLLGLGKY